MTKLLVDEGGVRRSFKVGDGVLIIGAGEGAALRLKSPDVAEEHAELDVRGKQVFLRARPGVVPPKVDGELIDGEQELYPGARIEIGDASILVEFDGAPRPVKVTPRPAPVRSRGSRPGAKSGAKRGRRRAPIPAGKPRPKSSGSPRASHRRPQRAPWVGPAIVLGVLAGVALFAGVIAPALFEDSGPVFEPLAYYNRATKALHSGQPEKALAELARVPDDIEIGGALATQIQTLREQIAEAIARRDLGQHNDLGHEFLRTQLKHFENEYLQGRPGRPAVRVFLTRLAEFEERWPEHPQLDWVRRMRERYSANVSLTERQAFEDIEFEVKMLTRADPRDFGEIFRVLEAFMGQAAPADRELAAELIESKRAERETWYEDKLQAARVAYDDDERGKSVEWLVRIVLYTGDPVMAAKGAERLVRFSDLDERLRGYRSNSPEKFEGLLRHPTIRSYVDEHPLD